MMTGHVFPQIGMGSTISGSDVYLMDGLEGLTQELGFNSYIDGSKSTVDVFFITAALMVGTAGLPHVIIRFFTVPKVKDARISAGWALLFISLLYTTAPAVASFARVNLIETINGPEINKVLPLKMPQAGITTGKALVLFLGKIRTAMAKCSTLAMSVMR